MGGGKLAECGPLKQVMPETQGVFTDKIPVHMAHCELHQNNMENTLPLREDVSGISEGRWGQVFGYQEWIMLIDVDQALPSRDGRPHDTIMYARWRRKEKGIRSR